MGGFCAFVEVDVIRRAGVRRSSVSRGVTRQRSDARFKETGGGIRRSAGEAARKERWRGRTRRSVSCGIRALGCRRCGGKRTASGGLERGSDRCLRPKSKRLNLLRPLRDVWWRFSDEKRLGGEAALLRRDNFWLFCRPGPSEEPGIPSRHSASAADYCYYYRHDSLHLCVACSAP